MATQPITATDPTAGGNDEAAFDAALENAQSSQDGGMTPELEEMMVTGAISIGGQMIIMPRANDILNEAMSDE